MTKLQLTGHAKATQPPWAKPVTISGAIETEINSDWDDVGVNRLCGILGKLIETLHENEKLTDDELVYILGGHWALTE